MNSNAEAHNLRIKSHLTVQYQGGRNTWCIYRDMHLPLAVEQRLVHILRKIKASQDIEVYARLLLHQRALTKCFAKLLPHIGDWEREHQSRAVSQREARRKSCKKTKQTADHRAIGAITKGRISVTNAWMWHALQRVSYGSREQLQQIKKTKKKQNWATRSAAASAAFIFSKQWQTVRQ